MACLGLAGLYEDEGRFTEALELATHLTRVLPRDPAGPAIESWMLRKLGRLDEAEARAQSALELEPDCELAYLTLIAVALDRGDHVRAREALVRVERIAPGTVGVALMTLEVALATGEPNAETALERARAVVRTTPLAFAGKDLAALEERMYPVVILEPVDEEDAD